MTSVKPPALRFSGYRMNENGKAQVFLPGHDVNGVSVDVWSPKQKEPMRIKLEKSADRFNWISPANIEPGSAYRFDIQLNDHDAIPTVLDIPPQYDDEAATGGKGKQSHLSVIKTKGANYWEFNQPDASEQKGAKYRLTIPGNPALTLEKIIPGQKPVEHPLEKKGNQWTFTPDSSAPAETKYRLRPALDLLEVTDTPPAYEDVPPGSPPKYTPKADQGLYNQISRHEADTPQKSAVIADIYQDSILTEENLRKLDREARQTRDFPVFQPQDKHIPFLPTRNHFNILSPRFGPQNPALEAMLSRLKQAGFTSVLFRPFTGGDILSSHGYWPTDPHIRNNTFQNEAAFRQYFMIMLQHGMKVYADGAFVSQGLNGVQMLANMAHNKRSPYWTWFKSNQAESTGAICFPKHAYEKFTFGILPTRLDAKGHRTVDFSKFSVRFINDPTQNGYNRKKPTFMELYDPRLEKPDGSPQDSQPNEWELKGSMDSVQKYRFPIDPQELREKKTSIYKGPGDQEGQSGKYLEWKSFRLDKASRDDSSRKWDGQVDVALMNTKNPEVVDFLASAVGHFTRKVANLYTSETAKMLTKAQAANPSGSETDWLAAITVPADGKPTSPLQVLPPITQSPADRLMIEELRKARHSVRPEVESSQLGKAFSKRMLDEIPMSVLHLPALFKANLTYPGFQKALREKERNWLSRFIANQVLQPLSRLWLVGDLFKGIRNLLFPDSFEDRLGAKLQKIFTKDVSSDAQAKLRNGRIQSIVAGKLAEQIYLSALTGESLEKIREWEADPSQLEDALYRNLPEDVLKQDPVTASKMLPGILKKGLDKMSSGYLARLVEQELRGLDPEMVEMANAVLQKREFGLNWRIDAAKDVADIDAVRGADPAKRAKVFTDEIKFVKTFWTQVGNTVRDIFKKATIIAELTDFEKYAGNDEVAKTAMKSLFEDNTFTSTPNMKHVYSPVMQLVNYAQRPDEFGAWQMKPSEFLNKHLIPMSQSFPFPSVRQAQNLTTSHDYATSSHAKLINPELFNMDYMRTWGLKDDFDVASAELETKECFKSQREELNRKYGINTEGILFNLREWLKDRGDTHIKDKLEQQGHTRLKGYFDEYEKCKDPKQKTTNDRPTPRELKGEFVDKLLDIIPQKRLQELGLANKPEAVKALKQALAQRITEPSEAKAMRGVIMNATLDAEWPSLKTSTPKETQALKANVQKRMWQGVDQAIQRWGAHFGYQPLDIALNHVFETFPEDWWKTDANGQIHNEAEAHQFLEVLKFNMYQHANRPVMEKLLREFAVQIAMPGNPSIYLPDFFAQGGSEFVKNMYAQNRNIIRVDKDSNDAEFRQFQQQAGKILNARKNLEVLNSGTILPVDIDDDQAILPVIRDNGKDQAIVLVDVAKQEPPNLTERKIGFDSNKYATVGDSPAERNVSNFKLNSPYLTPGAIYQDELNPGDKFTIDQNHQLVQIEAQGRPLPRSRNGATFHLHNARILKRLPKTTVSA